MSSSGAIDVSLGEMVLQSGLTAVYAAAGARLLARKNPQDYGVSVAMATLISQLAQKRFSNGEKPYEMRIDAIASIVTLYLFSRRSQKPSALDLTATYIASASLTLLTLSAIKQWPDTTQSSDS